MVHLFLEGGADINARTKGYGELKVKNYYRINHYFCIDSDPLMYMTVNMPKIDVFRTLFKYGANPNNKNENGHTAFMGIFVSTFLFDHYHTELSPNHNSNKSSSLHGVHKCRIFLMHLRPQN